MNNIVADLKLLKSAPVVLKAVKTYKDHGDGFTLHSANLYVGSKKVGEAAQDVWGGPLQWEITDEAIKTKIQAIADERHGDVQFERTQFYLSELLDAAGLKVELKRKIGKGFGLVAKSHEDHAYVIYPSQFSREQVAQNADQRHGKGQWVMLNDLF